ncbi:S-adenosyl-L-methionine-dependent methyltransferase [Gonapodya prolifera JEL478]|uniref:S-adenosyl-L-methionine-dependent methyltransferase n=1 Tax=Gonapodya prolifera (strain JEL478) TaxID=1344416 RepID=A0A139AHS8_GONPJ|nr:S-adenosyl-L-methionine-dependent methyltransferase [Gonapodya prolifera JEL478]|eukprot:KXS16366.1 S-adenosyl-L-methionine-dependent methyltransferase [Gonapodya prolifera JEL478]
MIPNTVSVIPHVSRMHTIAATGFSRAAGIYASSRPSYPADALRWLLAELGVGAAGGTAAPGARIADIGAGTGKLTRLLVRAGANVVAVEPVAAMRRKLAEIVPAATVLQGEAENIPLADSSMDAVTSAQAFHWFANRTTLGEFNRILKPHGRIGLAWNVRDTSVRWVQDVTQKLISLEADNVPPQFHDLKWRQCFENSPFTLLSTESFRHVQSGSPRTLVRDANMSASYVAALPREDRDKFARTLEELIWSHPDLKGKDLVEFPFQTKVFVFGRKSDQMPGHHRNDI